MNIKERGDEVWCASFTPRQVPIECPVCFGKKKVHLILGDGTKVEQKCAYCSPGYSEPSGVIMEWDRQPLAELKKISGVHIETTAKGTDVRYVMSDNYSYPQENVFDTAGEAQAFAFEKVEEYNSEEFEKALRRKQFERTNRTYSWGVGYHRREANRNREEAERHERMVKVCKERKKVEHITRQRGV